MSGDNLEGLFAEARRNEELGRLERATALYTTIVHDRPEHAEAWHRLGRISHREGKTADAVRYLKNAIEAAPLNAKFHNNLGNVYLSAADGKNAIAAYRQAIVLEPGYFNAQNNLGMALFEAGDLNEALVCFQTLVTAAADNDEYWLGLGGVLVATGELIEAEAVFRRALDIDDSRADTWFNLANTLRAQHRYDQAILAYHEVLERASSHPSAQNNLGGCYLALGDNAAARECFETSIALNPHQTSAWENLVRTRRFDKTDEALIARMQSLEDTPGLDELKRAAFNFALGKAKNDVGDYAPAFDHYKKANAIRARLKPFASAEHESLIDALCRAFSGEVFSSTDGLSDQRAVLIVGMPRSGTTLVEQILASHSRVAGGDELVTLSRIAADCSRELQGLGGYPAAVSSLSLEQCVRWANRYLSVLDDIDGEAVRVTDKMPTNFLHLGLVAKLLPKTRIIHCRRDPRDTCLSNYFQSFSRGHHFSYSLEWLARYYRSYQRLMSHWRSVLPMIIHEVDYEELITHPEEQIRALLDYCNLEFESECVNFHRTRRVVQSASHWQVRQPVYTSSAGRWKHYEAVLPETILALSEEERP